MSGEGGTFMEWAFISALAWLYPRTHMMPSKELYRKVVA